MNQEQFSFQVAFCRRNRTLFELLNDDQIEVIIKDAYNHYLLSPDTVSVNQWFEEAHGGWVVIYLASHRDTTEDVKSALINSAKS